MGAKAHDVDLSDSGRKIARKIAKSKGVPAEKDYGISLRELPRTNRFGA
jgi:hypothetical protein